MPKPDLDFWGWVHRGRDGDVMGLVLKESFYIDQAGLKLAEIQLSISQVLGLQNCATTPGFCTLLFKIMNPSSPWYLMPIIQAPGRYEARRIRSSRPVPSYKTSLGYLRLLSNMHSLSALERTLMHKHTHSILRM